MSAAGNRITKKQGGGSAANTIVAVSQFGGKAYYSCKVAGDQDGDFYNKELIESRVDTNLEAGNLPDGITGKCLVMISPDAERTMNTFLGITSDYSVKELNEEKLSWAKYIYIEGYLVSSDSGREAMIKAKKLAEEAGVGVSLTFSDPAMVKYFGDQMKEVVGEGVDLLFCNEEEAMHFTGSEDILSAREEFEEGRKTFCHHNG